MHMYGQRAAQNGQLWVTFFVTKYRDLFCDQGGGDGGGSGPPPPPPRYIHPWYGGAFWYIFGGFWYLAGGFFVHFWGFRGFQVHICDFSVHFAWSVSGIFFSTLWE